MFDPAEVSSKIAPGDKLSMTLHKAKPEKAGGFLANAQNAGLVPGGGGAPMPMPQMSAMSRPAVPGPLDHRALLLAHLRNRLMSR